MQAQSLFLKSMAPPQPKLNPEIMRKRRDKKFVVDEKSRKGRFKKRKSTLKNKARELQTLCDVVVCMVCSGPDGEVVTWPENKTDVHDIINEYKKGEKAKLKANKKYDLLTFLASNREKLEERLKKRKEPDEANKTDALKVLSSWEAKLSNLSEGELLGLCNCLDYKLQTVKERIRLLQMKENEKAIQVYNGDKSSEPNNLNMGQKDFHQPLLPLWFYGECSSSSNQQVFEAPIWPIQCYYPNVGSTSNSSNISNLLLGTNTDFGRDFGRAENCVALGENYYNNSVSKIDNCLLLNNNFSCANTSFCTQGNFDFMGNSSNNFLASGRPTFGQTSPTPLLDFGNLDEATIAILSQRSQNMRQF